MTSKSFYEWAEVVAQEKNLSLEDRREKLEKNLESIISNINFFIINFNFNQSRFVYLIC